MKTKVTMIIAVILLFNTNLSTLCECAIMPKVEKQWCQTTKGSPMLNENNDTKKYNVNSDGVMLVNEIMNIKVVVTGKTTIGSTPYYIRAAYNKKKDIIITHYINGNGLVSFYAAYIGNREESDDEIIKNGLVSKHSDSTGPLRAYTQYWHLFAQHGYPVPYFENSIGMTSDDIGAEWIDQLERHYKIGKVTDSYIWLLPVIYQDANGHYIRDWYSTITCPTITMLSYVEGGGSNVSTQNIVVSSISQEQLRPIMEVRNRSLLIDGNEITEPGTYYCNEFQVDETEIGYDPATISDWFGGRNGKPDLTGAEPHAEFTCSYRYKGAQCSVYTKLHLLKEAKFNYGGTQQQFFFDKGDYKAMFMIPKAASRNGIELDKPFNSSNSESTSYGINRTASHLKDIDDPVDRQIGMLYNPKSGDYLVGMAAGLSLVNGETVREKRNQNCLKNSNLLSFSPSNINKFYINAINPSPFSDNQGYYPPDYCKEINYYVCYFDPAENIGQVYWYMDGDRYIIYAHCQNKQEELAINVPKCMDGLKLSIVEKTDNTELLSETITDGNFYVKYNTDDANYIVLQAIRTTPEKYVLCYMVDGEIYKWFKVEKGATITPEAAPTMEGYTFSGWSNMPETMPAKDVTVTGTFTVNKYKLIYKVDGEEYKTSEVEYGTAIIAEAEPTKEGYTFSGWSEIPKTMPAKDVTVTGTFTVNKYKLIYKVDGEEYKTSEVEYGTTITAEAEPTKEGYTFSGWSEIPETMPAHDVTVIGTFTVNKYKLTYKVDGVEYKSSEVEYGTAISAEEEPTKEGYTFSGWSEIPETMPAHDVMITGTFTVNKYKLTYMVDGEEYKTLEVEYGTAIIAEDEPTKEGYTFSGWSEIPETMPAHDVMITGTFTVNKYKLTYMVDGEEYKTLEVEYGTAIIAEDEPTKEGYTFSGWSEIPETMPAKDVVITGSFAINSYTITYKIDGEVFKTESVEYGSAITPPEAPVREGYMFEWTDVPETMPAKDITIEGSYTSGIGTVTMEETDVKWYTIDGKQKETPQKGLNIMKKSNGKTKKVLVK